MSAIKQEPRKFIPLERKVVIETPEVLRAIIARDRILAISYRLAFKPGLAKFYNNRVRELEGRLMRLLEETVSV